LSPIASAANFVTIDCGRDGAFAKRILEEVLARDVFIRRPGVAPLDRCIRISCGRAQDLEVLAEVLPKALKAAG
jgi:histidinol-phosphate aminotransferase